MMISFGDASQFGNAYLSSAHRIAHAVANGYRLKLNDLGRYRWCFESFSPHPLVRLGGPLACHSGILAQRVVRMLTKRGEWKIGNISVLRDVKGKFALSGAELAQRAESGLLVHAGWHFRDDETLLRELSTVRQILKVKEELAAPVAAAMQKRREVAQHWIGIHVRRGDYRNFHGGRFYFEDKTYLRIAAEAAKHLGMDGESVGLIGFSHEPLAWPEMIGGHPVVTACGTWLEDFLAMSMCDLIIGPPSTFSGAASFARDVPWFQIKSRDASFNPDACLTVLQSEISVQ